MALARSNNVLTHEESGGGSTGLHNNVPGGLNPSGEYRAISILGRRLGTGMAGKGKETQRTSVLKGGAEEGRNDHTIS